MLIGVSGSYIDDVIRVGADEFRRDSSAVTSRAFDTKPSEDTPVVFNGLEVKKHDVGHSLGQKGYISRLKLLRPDSSFHEYRSMRAKLAWVVHSRPDIACTVSMAAQATEKIFGHESIKLVNKIIKHLQNTITIRVKYPKLDPVSLYLTVYSDASFNNNNDNSSQLSISWISPIMGPFSTFPLTNHVEQPDPVWLQKLLHSLTDSTMNSFYDMTCNGCLVENTFANAHWFKSAVRCHHGV